MQRTSSPNRVKLILQQTLGLSSGDELFHYVHVSFITSLEPEAVVNHESLVHWRDKLLINVSNTTRGLGGVLEGEWVEDTPYNMVASTHNIFNAKHSTNQRGFTNA